MKREVSEGEWFLDSSSKLFLGSSWSRNLKKTDSDSSSEKRKHQKEKLFVIKTDSEST